MSLQAKDMYDRMIFDDLTAFITKRTPTSPETPIDVKLEKRIRYLEDEVKSLKDIVAALLEDNREC